MKMIFLRIIPLILFIMLVSFFWRGLSLNPQDLPSVQVGKQLPLFQLPVLGDQQVQFSPAIMRGRTVLVNIWASWCAACTDEQVFLLKLAREGMLIYGINYKDNPQDALNWLSEWGNPYQLVGIDANGRVAIDLGVYGAPETFLIDKAGIIRYRHAGALTAEVWQQEFVPRIKGCENE